MNTDSTWPKLERCRVCNGRGTVKRLTEKCLECNGIGLGFFLDLSKEIKAQRKRNQ